VQELVYQNAGRKVDGKRKAGRARRRWIDDVRDRVVRILCQKVKNSAHITSGFPLSWLKKFPGLFQDPRSIFP